jgi:CheY-like chemotaxis protein
VRYEPAGLEADFFIPQEHIAVESSNPAQVGAQSSQQVTPGEAEQEKRRPLEGMSVLLLEDNLILALETEDLLQDLGAQVVFLASSIEAAAQILKSEHLDFALLDVHIGTHSSLEFALSVRDAGIPYVFATGYGENVDFGASHGAPAFLTKPYGRLIASSVIARAIAEKSAIPSGAIS